MTLLKDFDSGLSEINDAKDFDVDKVIIEVPEQNQMFKNVEYETEIALEQYKVIRHFLTRLENIKAVKKSDFDILSANGISLESFPDIKSYTEDYSYSNYDETVKAGKAALGQSVLKIIDVFRIFKSALKDTMDNRISKMNNWTTIIDDANDKFYSKHKELEQLLESDENFNPLGLKEKLIEKFKFYTDIDIEAGDTPETCLTKIVQYALRENLTGLEAKLLDKTDCIEKLVTEFYGMYANSAVSIFDKFVYIVEKQDNIFNPEDLVSSYKPIDMDIKMEYATAESGNLDTAGLVRSEIIKQHETTGLTMTSNLLPELEDFYRIYNIVDKVDSFKLEYVYAVNKRFKHFGDAELNNLLSDSFTDDYITALKVIREDLFVTLAIIDVLCLIGESYVSLIKKSELPIEDLIKLLK